ncbi:YcdB/YcdC domain-containing protein [Salibacterium sp. K-3]
MSFQTRRWYRSKMVSLAAVMGLSWTAGAQIGQAAPAEETEVTINAQDSSSGTVEESGDVRSSQADEEEAEITKDEAVEKLRSVIPVLEKADVDQVELRRNSRTAGGGEQLFWEIRWQYSEGSTTYGFPGRVNAITGDVISAGIHGPMIEEESDAYYPPELSEEEAAAKAKDLIEKAVPSVDVSQLKQHDSTGAGSESLFGSVGYSMSFVPSIDGVPATGQSINVDMSGSGEVTNFYNHTRPGQDYPDVEPSLSSEEAAQSFQENLDLRLAYYTNPRSTEDDVFLGWGPDPYNASRYLDATADEFLNNEGEPLEQTDQSYEELDAESTFEPVEAGEDGTISEEQAIAVIQEHVGKVKDREPDRASLQQHPGSGETSVWNLIWQPQDAQSGHIQAEVDAASGEVMTISQFTGMSGETDEGSGSASEEELKEQAVSTLAGLYPDASETFKLADAEGITALPGQNGSTFVFQRFAGDIPVQNDTISITMNNNGELMEYRTNLTRNLEEKIEGLSDETGEEAAQEKYSESLSAELAYQSFPLVSNSESDETETKLVYQKELSGSDTSNTIIDAETGEWRAPVSGIGGQSSANTTSPQDIDGHEAEDALQTLVQYQVLTPDEQGRVNPDEAITYGDWLHMAASAVSPDFDRTSYTREEPKAVKGTSPDDTYYDAVAFANEQDWLDSSSDTVDPGAALTKEQFVVSMVRILGYDQFATHMKEETPPFDDAGSITNTGAVNTAVQLDLISSDADTFNPDADVTKAQAAEHMMNMVGLQSSIDQNIGNSRYR